ncbi:three-Cys-motif partner protein TcmP [Falsiroseomonas sp. HW251]|uniref:three-Cys-motif partner protein TcmP n=1 Tax=Falsiroseomonas sp. HW251 TaxID=3390998 RepID=UPI003D312A9F
MSEVDTTPTVGPWAREKLDALAAYLDFYTKVLKNQGHWVKSTTFVDAFAGAGRARLRRRLSEGAAESLIAELDPLPIDADAEEYIHGSPRVALGIANPFSRYVFIERDPARVAEQEHGERYRIELRPGQCDEELDALLQGDLGRSGHLAVVFLDPFGMQLSWSMIERLAATKRIEVMINFTLGMGIQRVLPRSAELRPGWRETLDRFFGSPDWYGQVYEEKADLLGAKTEKRRDSGQRLLEWYRSRLKAAFGHVSPARLIKNTKGGHLYYLIWAGPHPKGLDGARYILSKGDKVDRASAA